MDETDVMIAELLLEEGDDEESVTELFLQFLMMELYINTLLRARGLGNREILELCQNIDKRRGDNEKQKSRHTADETEE